MFHLATTGKNGFFSSPLLSFFTFAIDVPLAVTSPILSFVVSTQGSASLPLGAIRKDPSR